MTGETRSLRQLVTGRRYSDHTFPVTAPSNVAVDNDATEVYQNLPEDLRDTTRILRVEVSSAELEAILTQMNPDDFEGSEHMDFAKYKELKDAADSQSSITWVKMWTTSRSCIACSKHLVGSRTRKFPSV